MPHIKPIDRLWQALEKAYAPQHDKQTPGRITLKEVNELILPTLESQTEISTETISLLQELDSWNEVDADAKNSIADWLRLNGGQKEGAARVLDVPQKGAHQVFLTEHNGFAVDAKGCSPQDQLELGLALFHAGEWIQKSFGSDINMFEQAAMGPEGKMAVLDQFEKTLDADLSQLSSPQQDQLLGNIGALLAEMIKSDDSPSLLAKSRVGEGSVRNRAFDMLEGLLLDGRLSNFVRKDLSNYLQQSDSFQKKLDRSQTVQIKQAFDELHPEAPFDYDAWQHSGKEKIVVDHVCGHGENFFFGFAKSLQEKGLGDVYGREGHYKFQLQAGDPVYGPAAKLTVRVPADDPMNEFGRPMEIEVRLSQYHDNMYQGMADPTVDVVSYGGHSSFGKNTLHSLRYAPEQVGHKVIARDLCCGADTLNAEAKKYPEASANSIASISSTYFRTADDPKMGTYSNESEGYSMLMTLMRGCLSKKSWKEIGARDLRKHANWWGHDSDNNWTYPGDPRGSSFRDRDGDGIPNVFDIMPTYNTFSIKASVSDEFKLRLPEQPAYLLNGSRAFQAVQFLNTATNYNPELQPFNEERKVHTHPHGIWFDGAEEPMTYVKFSKYRNGKIYVQLNSALSHMTLESLRAVLDYEFAKFIGQNEKTWSLDSKEEQVAMGLLFAATSLEYDDSYRDRAVFDGLKRIYAIPDEVRYNDFRDVVAECEDRHNYTGDSQGVRRLLRSYGDLLAGKSVGEPAVRCS